MAARLHKILAIALLGLSTAACGIYSFTGADIDYATTKTFQVNNFVNNAPIVEPKVARNFTLELHVILR
jgi:hypothetical protein